MTEIVRETDCHPDFQAWELRRDDGSLVTDADLGWPQPLGVTASFPRREDAEHALERLGCSDCGDKACSYSPGFGLALCATHLRERSEDWEADRAYDRAGDR